MGLSAAGLLLGDLFADHPVGPSRSHSGAVPSDGASMPRRTFGKTGLSLSLLTIGGYSAVHRTGMPTCDQPEELLQRAIAAGVNYIDTHSLGENGLTRTLVGDAIRPRRDARLVADGTRDRNYDQVLRHCELCLRELRVDHLDVYQLTDLGPEDDITALFSPNGAVRALERLRDEGVVRLLGCAGYRDPVVLLRAVEAYPFDVVTLPLNAADIHCKPFQTNVLPAAAARQMGIMATHATAVEFLFSDAGLNSMEDAMGYVYSFPITAAAVPLLSTVQLEQHAAIAARFKLPFTPARLAAIESLTGLYDGRWANWFKTA